MGDGGSVKSIDGGEFLVINYFVHGWFSRNLWANEDGDWVWEDYTMVVGGLCGSGD